ncbi:hypothetical protein C5C95_09920 [Rathayibacter sp. AY1B7]|nr:hypothetical protein C5C95_09920 [Rathayibacter sp. AY1B7]
MTSLTTLSARARRLSSSKRVRSTPPTRTTRERSLIRERQAEGIRVAKDADVYRGRAKKLSEQQLIDARRLIGDGVPKSQVARQLRVNPSTLYRALARPDVA